MRKYFSLPTCLPACLPTLIDPLPKLLVIASILSQGSLFLSTQTFLVIVSSSLVSGKLAFLHNGYIAAIENCYVPTAVKRTVFLTYIVSLLLGASFNTIFATCLMSLLLGVSFNTKLSLENFIFEHYSYYMIKCLKCVTVDQKNLQICIDHILLAYIFVERNICKKGRGCCEFSSAITGRYR